MTLLTVDDVAKILKVSYDTALLWVKNSGVKFVMVGRQYRVKETEIEKLFETTEKKSRSHYIGRGR